MKYIIFCLSIITIFSCETYSTRDMERDNPYPFKLAVMIQEGGKIFKFEDQNARMLCDRLPSYDECTPCEESYSQNECIQDPNTGESFTADSCMCKGNYHIKSQNGLEIVIKDPKKARMPSTFFTGIDAEIIYMNRPLTGKIMLTKSEIGTFIKQSNSSTVLLTDSYFLDIAGGFEANDESISLRSGVFYSVKPEDR